MVETKEKSKPDYTNSAENLCNPDEVWNLLAALHAEQAVKQSLEGKLKEQCSELVDGIAKTSELIAKIQDAIREAILSQN